MREKTRVVRLGQVQPPKQRGLDESDNEGTRIGVPGQVRWSNLRGLFDAHHRALAEELAGHPDPGVLVCVLGPAGIAGSLWLAATSELRVGTLGRHEQVDLRLPGDDALSLRHCLIMVRRLGDGVRIHVLDLSSSAGMQSEDFQPVHALDADGHFFLHVPGAVLAVFPTGAPLPWDPEALRPFESLAPREVHGQTLPPAPRWAATPSPDERSSVSSIRLRPGPQPLDEERLRLPGEAAAGSLFLESKRGNRRLRPGAAALEQGIVLGRYDRCAGSEVLADHEISRVHAVLFSRDGALFLADAGSTNGTWCHGREVRCAQITPGEVYEFGEGVARLAWTD